jgi:sialate O-acetylesterase
MVTVAAVFSNHMVLQRRKRIAVWGRSDADSVEVKLTGGNLAWGRASGTVKNGKWFVELQPQEAGGPYTLEVVSGEERVVFSDVMIGEVWLAGGQSNMEFELQNCKGGEETVSQAVPGAVRFYYTPKVAWTGPELAAAEKASTWELFTPENAAKWSAVGYFFAERLAEELGVTVGVIGCNWGGTSASCWIGREALEEHKCLASYLDEYDRAMDGFDAESYLREYEDYVAYQAVFDEKVGEYYRTSPNPTWDEAIALFGESRYPGPMGPRNFTRPCGLYETMLKRIIPYSIAGVIYYQGEEDDHKPYTYRTLLTALIEQWRREWNDETLPFLIVQLPVFRNEGEDDFGNWPFIREAQMQVFQSVKNTGIAVALELGEDRNIHPIDKKPVGERLAGQALALVYRKKTEAEVFGPVLAGYYIEEDSIILQFQYADDGFTFTSASGENPGFEIAGEDRQYHPAAYRAHDSRIALWSEEVQKPLFARYCWTNYRKVEVFGKNGLPMAPFRTGMDDGAAARMSRQGRIESLPPQMYERRWHN